MTKLSAKTKDAVWNLLGTGMFAANSFLLLMFVSRDSGIIASGEFGIAFTVSQLLFIVAIFGSNAYQMTDYSGRYSFKEYSALKLLSSAAAFVCCFAIMGALGFGRQKIILTLGLTLCMLIHSGAELYQSMLFKCKRIDLSGKVLFFRMLITIAAFAVAIYTTHNAATAVFIMTAVNIAATYFIAIRPSKRFLTPADSSFDKEKLKELVKCCVPLFLCTFLMTWIISCPKYIIELLYDDGVQGVFNMVFMPAQIVNLVGSFIFKPLLPRMSEALHLDSIGTFKRILRRTTGAIAAVTIVGVLAAYLLGAPVLSFIYNADLSDYSLEIALVVLGGGFEAVASLYYWAVIVMRRQKFVPYIYGGATVAAIAVGIPLIKTAGILGAVLSFAAVMLLCSILLYAMIGNKPLKESESGAV